LAFSTIRAVQKRFVQRSAALAAHLHFFGLPGFLHTSVFKPLFLASIANQNRFPFFYRENGNKKQGEVVVDPLEISPGKTTRRATPGGVINCFYLWRNSGNKKHGCPLSEIVLKKKNIFYKDFKLSQGE